MGSLAASRCRLRRRGDVVITLAVGLTLSIVAGAQSDAPVPAPVTPRSVWDGVYSAEQVARGKKGYQSLCARCHGESLGGGEASPPLVDKVFLEKWSGKTVGELVEYTRVRMPSDGPGRLPRKQCTDITAYMLSENYFPAGSHELESDLEKLNQIVITRKK